MKYQIIRLEDKELSSVVAGRALQRFHTLPPQAILALEHRGGRVIAKPREALASMLEVSVR